MNWILKMFFLLSLMAEAPIFGELAYDKISNQILNKCSKELEKRFPMSVMGTGGSGGYDIKAVHIKYQYRGEASIEEARRLYVDIAEVFIKSYNANRQLRPYLHHYPFNEQSLNLVINFNNPKNEKVSFVMGGTKDIEYFHETPDNYRGEEFFTEPYTAALEIVRNERKQQTEQQFQRGK